MHRNVPRRDPNLAYQIVLQGVKHDISGTLNMCRVGQLWHQLVCWFEARRVRLRRCCYFSVA